MTYIDLPDIRNYHCRCPGPSSIWYLAIFCVTLSMLFLFKLKSGQLCFRHWSHFYRSKDRSTNITSSVPREATWKGSGVQPKEIWASRTSLSTNLNQRHQMASSSLTLPFYCFFNFRIFVLAWYHQTDGQPAYCLMPAYCLRANLLYLKAFVLGLK